MSTVYTGGTFDLLHAGHLELLAVCRQLAGDRGRVVVSLNTDDFVERYKGAPPVRTWAERAETLRALRDVDLVVANTGGEDSRVALDVVGPDLVAIGDDWLDPGDDERRYHQQLGLDQDWLDERGMRIVYIPRTRGRSSSVDRPAFEAAGARELGPAFRLENGRVVRR